MDRRKFIVNSSLATIGLTTPSLLNASSSLILDTKTAKFKISLSQWAYHRDIFGGTFSNYKWFKKMLETDPIQILQGDLDTTDIVLKAKGFGLHGVDLVSSMIAAYKTDKIWLKDFSQKAQDNDVEFVCLMTDAHFKIGDSNEKNRLLSIEEHKEWIDVAAELNCNHVRVNPYGDESYLQVLNQCTKSINELSDYAKSLGMKLTMENHGHPSSNGAWTNMLCEIVNDDNFGVFLDFGNFFMGGFTVRPRRFYDTYQGVKNIAPYVTGISAKTRGFKANGDELTIDYKQSIDEVMKYNFSGWMSAEYEGSDFSCDEGAIKTIELLKRYQY